LVWSASFGSTASLAADGNLDREVDARDYVIWRRNLGNAMANASPHAGEVPEPMSLVLVALFGMVLGGTPLCRRYTSRRI
jgi:hypothetical protein